MKNKPLGKHEFHGIHAAFTLVELLVVIGIIAVLVGILFPAFTVVRDAANTMKCLSNLKQLGEAQATYANEYNGYALPAGYLIMPPTSQGYNSENYATLLVNDKLIPVPGVGSVNEMPDHNASVFFCPTGMLDLVGVIYTPPVTAKPDPVSRADPTGQRCWRTQSASTNVIIDTWYGINADWNASQTYHCPSHMLPDATFNPPKYNILPQLGSIQHSSEMVFLYDGIFYDLNYNANRLDARHGSARKTNLLFFDGHAATYDAAELPGGKSNLKADTNQPSNPFAGSTPSSVLLNDKTTRWRMDEGD